MENNDLTEKKRNIIKHKNLLSYIKTSKEVLRFGGIEIKKKIKCHKRPFFEKKKEYIEKLLVTNKIFFKKKL